MKEIYCIGDSHISIFADDGKVLLDPKTSGKWDRFEAINVGPFLAYNLMDKSIIFEKLDKIGDRDLLLCFGEIDCRAQVKRHCDSGRDYQEIIMEIVEKYFEVVEEIKKKLKLDCTIYIMSVTPELKEEPNGIMYKRDGEHYCFSYGTLSERRQYKELFNEIIKNKSKLNGYKYVPLSDYVTLKDGTANGLFYFDDIHLHPNKMKSVITEVFSKLPIR